MSQSAPAYDPFAWLYNQHWAGFSQMVLPVLDVLVLEDLPANARILDVACGTGHLARALSGRGYRVTGLDLSGEMLAYARQNAPEAEFLQADARDFSLPPRFDAALSTFDSLNHVLALPELTAVFGNIARALLPGGRFCFDLNMEAGFLAGWNGTTGDSFDDYAYIWKNDYEPEQRLARFDATLFRLQNDSWLRTDVSIYERCFSLAEIEQALGQAGFRDLHAYQFNEDLQLVSLNQDGLRGFFTCRRA